MLSSITVDRLKVVDRELKPAEKPGETGSNLDHDTQGALLRFARFINKEGEGRKAPPQKRKTVPSKDAAKSHPYAQSMAVLNRHMDSGLTIDIYV